MPLATSSFLLLVVFLFFKSGACVFFSATHYSRHFFESLALRPSTAAWASLCVACERGQGWQEALEVVEQAGERGWERLGLERGGGSWGAGNN